MKKNFRYLPPCITIMALSPEGSAIMAASPVEFIIVAPDTIDQEVDDVDFTEDIFNHQWE